MSLTTTTLSSAVTAGDSSISVGSATGFAAGNLIRIDGELYLQTAAASGTSIPVRPGVNGTPTSAHQASANVVTGLPSDFTAPTAGTDDATTYPAAPGRVIRSYSAAGAITLPTPGQDMVAVINGTSALAMTVAAPTKEIDGCLLIVVGGGKAAHTVTFASGLGNAGSSYDVLTSPTGGQVAMAAIACNGFWCAIGPIGGTVTAIAPAIA